MATYDEIRQRHVADLLERFPTLVEGLRWDAERLATVRQEGLRSLVTHAVAKSPWHRERLAGIDPTTITEADLVALPTMSKRDVRAAFDDIVTDRRITTEVVEAHLAALDRGPSYLFDEYHVVATGGSSGARTIVVWDWNGWIDCFVSLARQSFVRSGGLTADARPVAGIAADHPSHMSAATQHTFSNPAIDMHKIPATLPIPDIVRRLNELQPETVIGYASVIHRLALEADAGRLRIRPDKVLSGSEALLPETRVLAERVWGVIVDNMYGASETGGMASSCGSGPWMHLDDDLNIIEIEHDRVLVTNLMNKVMPLIRYELDDRATLIDVECPCGTAHRTIADVEGRSNETFTFGDTAIHPIVFSSAIGKERGVAEYQVRQSGDTVDIDVIPQGEVDAVGLRSTVERALDEAGAHGVKVLVSVVDSIPRHGSTAKLRRFVPE